MTTVPVAGNEAESSSTMLVDSLVKAPSKVDSPTPNLTPLQSPSPQPPADSSTASPKASSRGCLCPDGKTYSKDCCDGTLEAQGVGKV